MDIETRLSHHRPELERIAAKFAVDCDQFTAEVAQVVRQRHAFFTEGRYTLCLGTLDDIITTVMDDLQQLADETKHSKALLRSYLADPI